MYAWSRARAERDRPTMNRHTDTDPKRRTGRPYHSNSHQVMRSQVRFAVDQRPNWDVELSKNPLTEVTFRTDEFGLLTHYVRISQITSTGEGRFGFKVESFCERQSEPTVVSQCETTFDEALVEARKKMDALTETHT